jgi:transposase
LFAALDVKAGTIVGKCMARHRASEFRKFLDEIERNVPANLDVHIVMDNYATHKTKPIRNWFAKRPRWHVHFTPTSASWINQVERFFALLTRARFETRRVPLGRRTRKSDQGLHRRYQYRSQAVPLDQDRRRHPGQHPTLLPSHTRRKRLE